MNILENKSKFSVEKMWSITERDGNTKRPYLLLNKLQAKYIPIDPDIAFSMFDELAEEITNCTNIDEKNIIVIGFAETATAIGARIAEKLAENKSATVMFLPTTREVYSHTPVVEFEEVHSHAVEQILYGNKYNFQNADIIVFAEDEVTTGNTILNCVKKLNLNCDYITASLLNCMNEDEIKKFEENNIQAVWLTKTDKEGFENLKKCDNKDMGYQKNINTYFNYTYKKVANPRFGVLAKDYAMQCNELKNVINIANNKSICILGTEECMYPAINLAQALKRNDRYVVVSATTRVPSCTSNEIGYPLKNRYKIQSMYNKRDTYIYNVSSFDQIIVVTDGENINMDIVNVLKQNGTKDVTILKI